MFGGEYPATGGFATNGIFRFDVASETFNILAATLTFPTLAAAAMEMNNGVAADSLTGIIDGQGQLNTQLHKTDIFNSVTDRKSVV